MILNVLKTALRNFIRNLQYSFINLFGFSIGLLSFLIIIIYVNHENHYDRFHKNGKRLYRAGWIMKSPNSEERLAVSTAAFGPSLFEEFPQVIDFSRFSTPQEGYLNYNKNDYKTEKLMYADSSLFRMFSFKLLRGDKSRCLKDPYSIVLTKSLADKIFGGEDPMGKSLKWNKLRIFSVTGIAEDPLSNSHLDFSALVSFSTLYSYDNTYLDWNGGVSYYTYILLAENSEISATDTLVGNFMHKHINYLYEPAGWKITPIFQQMKDIYLDNSVIGGMTGNPVHNFIYLITAIFILILACINFMNLSTARYTSRAGEVAVRKTFGATRGHVIRQFLGESLLMTFLGMIIAMVLLEAAMPVFRNLSGKDITIYNSDNLWILCSLPLIIFLISLIAGSYPAFYLSSFTPLHILRSTGRKGKLGISFRNFLVLFQFSVGIVLILSTIMVYKQVRYLRDHDLGFDKENLVIFPMTSMDFRQKQDLVQQEIMKLPGVVSTSAISFIPGITNYREGFTLEGMDKGALINRLAGDYGMIRTLGLEVKEGRSFSREFSTDQSAYMVNESLVRFAGWDDAIGKSISRDGEHKVIGVLKDFNFTGLNQPITPLIINLIPYDAYNSILVRYKTDNIKKLLSGIEIAWKDIDQDEPFDYNFVSAELENLYRSDMKFGQIFLTFAILAIIIAALGLFGLASFEAERRTREIGIRKVMGSTAFGIVRILVGKFTFWVVMSNIIAWPVAWLIIQRWLDNFAYKTETSILIFVLAGLFSLLIALMTVTIKSLHTAQRNPVYALRHE